MIHCPDNLVQPLLVLPPTFSVRDGMTQWFSLSQKPSILLKKKTRKKDSVLFFVFHGIYYSAQSDTNKWRYLISKLLTLKWQTQWKNDRIAGMHTRNIHSARHTQGSPLDSLFLLSGSEFCVLFTRRLARIITSLRRGISTVWIYINHKGLLGSHSSEMHSWRNTCFVVTVRHTCFPQAMCYHKKKETWYAWSSHAAGNSYCTVWGII